MCSNHELQATLNALGYLEDGEYFKSRDCLNASKDLIRYLRRDDPTEKTIRRELLRSDVISNDLIPLIKTIKSKKDAELFDLTLRLLVNLYATISTCFFFFLFVVHFVNINLFLTKTKALSQLWTASKTKCPRTSCRITCSLRSTISWRKLKSRSPMKSSLRL